MKKDNKKVIYWLLTGCVLIFTMVIVGGITRLTHSGLSISNYKLISGTIPPLNELEWHDAFELYKQYPEYQKLNKHFDLQDFKDIYFWEWLHRVLGRFIGLVFLIPFIYFLIRKQLTKPTIKKTIILLCLGSFQGFLGWYMVSSGLINKIDVSHYRLSIHLFTAFFILSIVFWNYLELTQQKINQVLIKYNLIKFFLVLLFIQLIIGAFASGMDAGEIYNTWPLMGSSYFPDDSNVIEFLNINVFDNPSIVQFIHRNLAYLIIIVYIYLLIFVFKDRNRIFRKPILIIGISLFLQVILGVITILSGVKIIYASLHQINSILIILSTLYFLYISKHKEKS